MERHRIGIVIPALNESGTIAAVVTNASRYGVPIVVDDGSHDRTSELATAAGATVVRHSVNRGYDQALNSGFARATELGCEYVVTMDADGQHDPTVLKTFIQALDDGAELVVGMRDRHQRVSETLFAWVGALKWGIRDPLCGMKAYRIGLYVNLGHFDSYDSIGTELAIYAARNRSRIAQVPVKTRDRGDSPRFGRRFSSNKRILRALRYALWPPARGHAG
jgi:glycosyltransferase involved in cell wall biosynthesis